MVGIVIIPFYFSLNMSRLHFYHPLPLFFGLKWWTWLSPPLYFCFEKVRPVGRYYDIGARGGRRCRRLCMFFALPWPHVFTCTEFLTLGRCQVDSDIMKVAQTRFIICLILDCRLIALYYLPEHRRGLLLVFQVQHLGHQLLYGPLLGGIWLTGRCFQCADHAV